MVHLSGDETLLALVVAFGPLRAAVHHVGAADSVLPRTAPPDVFAAAPVAARLLLRAGQRGVALVALPVVGVNAHEVLEALLFGGLGFHYSGGELLPLHDGALGSQHGHELKLKSFKCE